MSEKVKKRKKDRTDEKSMAENKEKKVAKEKVAKERKQQAASAAFSLLADVKAINPTLSTLFAGKLLPAPVKESAVAKPLRKSQAKGEILMRNDEDLSSVDESLPDGGDVVASDDGALMQIENLAGSALPPPAEQASNGTERKRKRKRNDADDELEDAYLRRLAREEVQKAKAATAERAAKRQKPALGSGDQDAEAGTDGRDEQEDEADSRDDMDVNQDKDNRDATSTPPKHETEQAAANELSKATRTVFLSNVSTFAITSKSARKKLESYLTSFFSTLSEPKDGDPKHKLESLRFRSTPYSTSIPKKAAFAKKELMDGTTKSTNAYAVYSSEKLAREATRRLNGTTILDRHLRVDSISHPAKVDHKRCVFVGNLGFVNDESNIQKTDEEAGFEKRKLGKMPADIEEGLWRTFGKCGTVESVRVIRDSTTRVGKGIAYVQFEDENAVEAALLYNEKKFPPMLPRKLRVSRAKAQKRNTQPGSDRPGAAKPTANGYQRKITGEEASMMGRAGKLLGRAAAAKIKQPGASANAQKLLLRGKGDWGSRSGIRKPESFVFEGHRASVKSGKSGLKLGGKGRKKSGKPTSRSAKRGAAFKAGGRKKSG